MSAPLRSKIGTIDIITNKEGIVLLQVGEKKKKRGLTGQHQCLLVYLIEFLGLRT